MRLRGRRRSITITMTTHHLNIGSLGCGTTREGRGKPGPGPGLATAKPVAAVVLGIREICCRHAGQWGLFPHTHTTHYTRQPFTRAIACSTLGVLSEICLVHCALVFFHDDASGNANMSDTCPSKSRPMCHAALSCDPHAVCCCVTHKQPACHAAQSKMQCKSFPASFVKGPRRSANLSVGNMCSWTHRGHCLPGSVLLVPRLALSACPHQDFGGWIQPKSIYEFSVFLFLTNKRVHGFSSK